MTAIQFPHLIKALIIGDSSISHRSVNSMIDRERERFMFCKKLTRMSYDEVVEQLKNELWEIPSHDEKVPAHIVRGEDHISYNYLAHCLRLCDSEMIDQTMNHFEKIYQAENIESLFSQIKCPVLIIQANPHLDGMILDEVVARVTQVCPQTKHVKKRTAGHQLHLNSEKMELKCMVLNHILSFVGKVFNAGQ